MRPVDPPPTRRWLRFAAAALALSGFAAGCGSSKPAYCASADQLKTSVQSLGDVDVAKNGLDSLTTALSGVKTSATTFATDAKSAFAPQITALQQSLSSLDTATESAHGQPVTSAAESIVSSLTQVKNAATEVNSAVSGNGK